MFFSRIYQLFILIWRIVGLKLPVTHQIVFQRLKKPMSWNYNRLARLQSLPTKDCFESIHGVLLFRNQLSFMAELLLEWLLWKYVPRRVESH